MDYETPDGSQFSLREEWTSEDEFQGTLITAFVEGHAFVGKSPQRMHLLDEFEVLQLLEPVPVENTFPPFAEDLTQAPPFNPEEHYLKAPQFTYEDREPGRTFVADRLRSEVDVLERLSKHPHPNIVGYRGCVVKEGRITHTCLQKCWGSLAEYQHTGLSEVRCEVLLAQVRDGIEHLHAVGFAHNDINPDNICVDQVGKAVIIDFDSALPFGERLVKGVAAGNSGLSDRENDYHGLELIRDFLLGAQRDRLRSSPAGSSIDGREN